jgi:hypothetical protein
MADCRAQERRMTEATTIVSRRNWRPLALIAVVVGLLIAGTTALWAYYGTTVFFEMVAAGIAMCL